MSRAPHPRRDTPQTWTLLHILLASLDSKLVSTPLTEQPSASKYSFPVFVEPCPGGLLPGSPPKAYTECKMCPSIHPSPTRSALVCGASHAPCDFSLPWPGFLQLSVLCRLRLFQNGSFLPKHHSPTLNTLVQWLHIYGGLLCQAQ